ncbi:hypothetical protein JCM19239_5761 [Vibrio variabilis]|uniref:Uncharacterized protein n=1 Tax=Vibrio variabilis TaxID=990271 RepID=A0ABQ0JII1_9VIBR|nr:hypothetical protein JCM19239_5761 [Vibrio variabilis]
MPKSRETAEYIKAVEPKVRDEHIYQCYTDTLDKLSETIDQKSVNIEHAYDELSIAAWLLGLLGAITIIKEIVT